MMTSTTKLLLMVGLLSTIIGATDPQSKDIYRLTETCKPINYKLHLTLDQRTFLGKYDKFDGQVTISFSCSASTNSVQLHADKKFINITTLRINGISLHDDEFSINSKTDILKISTNEALLAKKKNTLEISFTGKINKDVGGLYFGSYLENNVKTYLVSTHFEATYARRMFPCFDEPSMKATFDVEVTVPKDINVFSNTNEEETNNDRTRKTVKFQTTPVMSTYLLALVAAKYDCSEAGMVNQVQMRVCSKKGSEKLRQLARKYAPKSLFEMNEFANLDYGTYAGKLDLITIPDLPFGAMENWGLMTFRENYLLWDVDESSVGFEQEIVDVITHEIAHQWFGNLVTLQWWSETYLNEGFATYCEYHITNEFRSEWELKKQFVLNVVQTAMLEDGDKSAQSLISNCSTSTEIGAKFGVISYNKGGSIFYMVQHFMGEKHFKKGLQYYLNKYKTGTVTSENLWSSLAKHINPEVSKLPANLSEVMHNWTRLPGCPLLHVKQNGLNITITQKRFLVQGQDDKTEWYIPISYSTSSQLQFETTSPTSWLRPNSEHVITLLNESDWIILNNKVTAYYRTNYETSLWMKIKEALDKPDHGGIPEVNRAQFVDDLFNIARASEVKYSEALGILKFLENDSSYYPWHAAFTGFSLLFTNTLTNPQLKHAIENELLTLMGNLYSSVSSTTHIPERKDHVFNLKQSEAFYWACRLGNEDCLQHIHLWFHNFRHAGARVPKNLKKAVYCNVLRYSNDTKDWDFLWGKYLSTDLATEETTILEALSCTRDRNLLKRYLQMSIHEDSKLRKQDGIPLFEWVCKENPENADIALNFIIENFDQLSEKYQEENALGELIEELGNPLSDKTHIQKLKDFKVQRNLPEDIKTSIDDAISNIQDGIEWLSIFEEDLEKFYGITSGANR